MGPRNGASNTDVPASSAVAGSALVTGGDAAVLVACPTTLLPCASFCSHIHLRYIRHAAC